MVASATKDFVDEIILQLDVGIPLYRSEILGPKAEHQGTTLVSHTFKDAGFLPQLKIAGQQHRLKLTGVLHAAMLKAIYDISDVKPDPDEIYYSGSPTDLRNGHILPEYSENNKYMNLAVVIQSIKVHCNLFEGDVGGEDRFWKAAGCIGSQWETIKLRKDLTRKADSDAKALIESLTRYKYALLSSVPCLLTFYSVRESPRALSLPSPGLALRLPSTRRAL